jgi:hypothetical protein
MPKYTKAVWRSVLEAAREFDDSPFTPIQIISKIHEKDPSVKDNTIRCHVIGMTPNHPSSKHYPSVSQNHPSFWYLGNGQFRMLSEKERTEKEETKPQTTPNTPVSPPQVSEYEKLRQNC